MKKENVGAMTDVTIRGGLYDEDDEPAQRAMQKAHLRLLESRPEEDELDDIRGAPLFTESVRKYAVALAKKGAKHGGSDAPCSQYGLIGADISDAARTKSDPRVFWNIAAPSSFFICGSQGSGKSHHLSCLLENALVPCAANVLPRPLTGIIFHCDTFISDSGGSPCEAAWLASNTNIEVRVLCPPTNIYMMRQMYSKLPGVKVEELRLKESDFNTTRMMDLMAISSGNTVPLYMSVVNRLIREQRIKHKGDTKFDYLDFKMRLGEQNLTDAQLLPLTQRLDTLESFMVDCPAKELDIAPSRSKGSGGRGHPAHLKPVKSNSALAAKGGKAIDWTPKNGTLTIVDLSCPCVTSEMACSLFNISLSLFLEQNPESVGRVIALDEAHKYMNDSPDSQTLTNSLLSVIRLQRHVGARILIATQEPTISPKLLDLCSVTVCHRFTSPEWFKALKHHIAAASTDPTDPAPSKGAEVWEKGVKKEEDTDGDCIRLDDDGVGTLVLEKGYAEIFTKIVSLKTGEALVFAPSAAIGVKKAPGEVAALGTVQRLAHGVMKIRVRNRITADGGRSIMA